MEQIITISRNNDKITFLYTDTSSFRTNCEIITVFPIIKEEGLEELVQKYDWENIVKNKINNFKDYCINNKLRMVIVFENNDVELFRFLQLYYNEYLIRNTNLFNRVVTGVTLNQRVKDYFHSEDYIKNLKDALILNDYITSRIKEI